MDLSRAEPTFVGRNSELAALIRLRDKAASGHGHVVVIEGEPGIGKSRLVDEALAGADEMGFAVLRADAEEMERRRPFGVLSECLQIPQGTGRRRSKIRRLLQAEPAQPGDPAVVPHPSGREFAVVEEMVALVQEFCAKSPIVMVVEDLQWADASSLLVLHRLARVVPQMPALLVSTTRPVPRGEELERLLLALDDRGSTTVQLGPLSPEAVAAIAEDLLGAQPPSLLRSRLKAAGGNAFFVIGLLRALEAAGALNRPADIALTTAEGPSSLPVTILHWLSFLPNAVVDILRLASVLGVEFTATELATVAGKHSAALVGPLREAMVAGVLAEIEAGIAFRHDVIRETLYLNMPKTLREALHADAARALSSLGAPSLRVAEHVMRGAAAGDEAVDWLHRAAREAATASPAVAVELLDRALELASASHSARNRLLVDKVLNLMWSGRVSDAEDLCQDVLGAAPDSPAASALRLCLAKALVAQGRATEALGHFEAVDSSLTLSQSDHAEARAWAAHARWLSGDLDGGVATAEGALELAEAVGNEAAKSVALAALAGIAVFRGKFASALELSYAAIQAASDVDDVHVQRFQLHCALAVALLEVDRTNEADIALRQGQDISVAVGNVWNLPYYHSVSGMGRFWEGRWDDAIADVETAVQLSDEFGTGHTVMPRSVRSLIALHRDDLDTAERWLRVAEKELAVAPAQYRSDWLLWARGLLAEARGASDLAFRTIRDAWNLCVGAGLACEYSVLGPDLVRLALEARDCRLAAEAVEAVERVSTENAGVAVLEGAALRCLALAEGNAEVMLRSVDAYQRAHRPFEGALAAEDAAALLAAEGRLCEARPLLEHACAVYERLGAVRALARTEARLRIHGVRRGRRGARRRPKEGWASLTDSEKAVVALVAQGMSNPEIAERMFLSPRTVQTHVSHVLAKLELTSRVDVALAAARHDPYASLKRSEPRAQRGPPRA